VLGFATEQDEYWFQNGQGGMGGGNSQADGFVQWANGLQGQAPTGDWSTQQDASVFWRSPDGQAFINSMKAVANQMPQQNGDGLLDIGTAAGSLLHGAVADVRNTLNNLFSDHNTSVTWGAPYQVDDYGNPMPVTTPGPAQYDGGGVDFSTPQDRAAASYAREVEMGRNARGQLAFGPMGTNNASELAGGLNSLNGLASTTGNVAGVYGTTLDILKFGGYLSKATSDTLEIVSRRIGLLGLGVSMYKIYNNPSDWHNYVDGAVGVAALTIDGAAAPYVAAGAGVYTLWSITNDLMHPETPGSPRH